MPQNTTKELLLNCCLQGKLSGSAAWIFDYIFLKLISDAWFQNSFHS